MPQSPADGRGTYSDGEECAGNDRHGYYSQSGTRYLPTTAPSFIGLGMTGRYFYSAFHPRDISRLNMPISVLGHIHCEINAFHVQWTQTGRTRTAPRSRVHSVEPVHSDSCSLGSFILSLTHSKPLYQLPTAHSSLR